MTRPTSPSEFEYNVARQAPDGTLWDLFEDEICADLDEARKQQEMWAEEVDDQVDPVVIVRRVKPLPPAAWEVVQS